MFLGEAKTPEGMRVYAIGDVHGCDGLLAEAHAKIAAELAARPAPDHRVIHVGDYSDRGPDSAGVIGRLARLSAENPHIVCLRGNHDDLLLDFLDDPLGVGPTFLANGGGATLASYGITTGGRSLAGLAEQLAQAMPPGHRTFLAALTYTARFGDYFFCHAGVRPGVPLDAQDPYDLVWIREEFLFDERDLGAVIVHGHTPSTTPQVRRNRIGIDTGAVFGGPLTVLVLEGSRYRFL